MEYHRIERDKVYSTLKSLEPLTVATHRDADGMYSLALLDTVFDIEDIYTPDIFGDYEDEKVSLDLGPALKWEWNGIAIDHHPHPDIDQRDYSLIWDYVPTGLMVWRLFKDKIPVDQWWKAAGSCVGDGQPELIPNEIFDTNPVLLERRGSIYKSQYNKITLYQYDLYKLLSSPVNATCRTGKAVQAAKILKVCKRPDDVLSHPMFKSDQEILNKEIDSVINQFGRDKKVRRSAIIIGDRFLVVPFESKYFVASRVAQSIQSDNQNYTVIALNEEKEEISIRGTHAAMVQNLMIPRGWSIGGHSGYMGGNLARTSDEFIRDLREGYAERRSS